MMNALLTAGVLTGILCAPRSGSPLQDAAPPYGWDCPAMGYLPFHEELLVSTEQLARLIEEGAVTLIHVGFDETYGPIRGRIRYGDGHLPGARYLAWKDLVGSEPAGVSLGVHGDLFRNLGISGGDRLVFYDTGLGFEAAAAFVAFDALGLAGRAALLDGQWSKWASEGRPLIAGPGSSPPLRSDLDPLPSRAKVGQDEWDRLRAHAGKEPAPVTLIDARRGPGSTPKTFPGPWARIPWVQNLVSPNYPALKGEADLRRLWAQVPSQGDRPVWVAARSWVEAAPVYFAARLLGYPVRILEGSMEEEGAEETPS